MLKDTLQKQIQEAMKSGDSVRVSTLRLLSSALHNEEIALRRGLTEEEEQRIVKRQVKQRQEAIDAYDTAGRAESADKERQEAEILKEFLPSLPSEEEIGRIVDEVIVQVGEPKNFGQVMGEVMKRVGIGADGNTVARVVRQCLSTKH